MRLVSIPFCRVPQSAERLGRTATAASEVSTTYRPVPPPVVAPPLPSPIVPPSAGPEPVGNEGLGRSAVPSLAHPPAKSISPRLMAASNSGAVLPRMFRHVRVIDGLLRDIQKPGVECPLIVYTDLDTSWLLAGFGDEGRSAHASCRCGIAWFCGREPARRVIQEVVEPQTFSPDVNDFIGKI
jgi:hypothetical protein